MSCSWNDLWAGTESGTALWRPWLSHCAQAAQPSPPKVTQLWTLEVTQLWERLCHEATVEQKRFRPPVPDSLCQWGTPETQHRWFCPVPVPSASLHRAQAGFPRCFWGVTRGDMSVMMRSRGEQQQHTHIKHPVCEPDVQQLHSSPPISLSGCNPAIRAEAHPNPAANPGTDQEH